MKRPARRTRKTPAISLIVEEPHWRDDASILRLIRRAVRLALGSPPASKAGHLSLTILLTNNRRLRNLNRDFRGKDKPTNVLSFPSAEESGSLGDIALALEILKSEARAQKKTLAEHAAHLALHGTLHLLGYDHEKPSEARGMEALEIALLARLGIADPYRPRPYTRGRKAS
jgi:probable rRNA maturation factor